jgi:hypothetical protein
MVEQHKEEDIKDENFVDVPAILEKIKASAEVTDGKHQCQSTVPPKFSP